MTSDKKIVASDVHHIGEEDNPHRHLGAVDGIGPLREHIEHRHRHHSGQIYQEIRAYERQQLLRLPQAMHIYIYD